MNDFDNDVEIIYFVCFILLMLEFNDQTKTIWLVWIRLPADVSQLRRNFDHFHFAFDAIN